MIHPNGGVRPADRGGWDVAAKATGTCARTAEITARAICSAGDNEALKVCDQEFYAVHEIDEKLMVLVESIPG